MKIVITLLALLMVFGCASKAARSKENEIDSFRHLLGIETAELVNTLADAEMHPASIASHEPGESESAVLITINGSSFLSVGNDKVEALLFREPGFVTRNGAMVGQSFCDILVLYPNAKYRFEIDESFLLRLQIVDENITLDFDTTVLPLENYLVKGFPEKDDSSLCESNLNSMEVVE